ncbi:10767_t:CDS:2, partial [Gigaspora margarita]
VSLEIRKSSIEKMKSSARKGYYWEIGKGVEKENSGIRKGYYWKIGEREGFVKKIVANEEFCWKRDCIRE